MANEAAIAEAMAKQLPDFNGDAHEYLQAVYRGELKADPLRMQAAANAVRYEKPALAAVAVAPAGKGLEQLLADIDESRHRKVLTIEHADKSSASNDAQGPVLEPAPQPSHTSSSDRDAGKRSRLLAMREQATRLVAAGITEAQAILAGLDEELEQG
jgi:hypothetical protein